MPTVRPDCAETQLNESQIQAVRRRLAETHIWPHAFTFLSFCRKSFIVCSAACNHIHNALKALLGSSHAKPLCHIRLWD